MRIAKMLGWIAGAIVVLIVIVLIGVRLFVNPNNYKGRIQAEVKSATGRDLALTGDLKLSVFPWVALELGPATLSSPPGFGDTPFLSFQHAAVRVKLLPLLGKQLEVAKVQLDGLNLNLRRNAQGQGNWSSGQAAVGAASPAPTEKTSSGLPQLQSLEGIAVTHGHVSYPPYTVDDLNFETGAFAPGKTVPVTLQLNANRGVAGESFDVSGKLNFSLSDAGNVLHVAALAVNGGITEPGGGQPLHWELAAPTLDADLRKQTLALPAMTASLAGAKLMLSASGTQIIEDPHLSGSLDLSPLALREFAPQLGVTLPLTQDPHALSSFAASFKFAHDAKGSSLDDVVLKLDDTTLQGKIDLVNGTPATLTFNLAADRIDLDRYTAPASGAPAAAQKSAAPASKAADTGPPTTVKGTFVLAAAHVGGLDFTNFRTTLDDTNSLAHLNPTTANLYGGSFMGDITYDQRMPVPAIALNVQLANIDAAHLVANSSAKGRVSGKANVNLNVTARGTGADEMTRTLNGKFDLTLVNGALEGVDLGYAVAEAQALLGKQVATSVANTHKTAFDTFRMLAPIVNGVATTHDLTISSAVLRVTGQGSVTLPTDGIDMALLVKLMNSAQGSAVDIPVKVTGKYNDPTIRPDLTAAAKGALQNAVKQKAQDILKKNGLGGLFGH